MRYFTFKRQALAVRQAGQKLRFTRGKGFWLFGKAPAGPVTMYDSVNLGEIPLSARAVAGYVNGWWPTFKLLARFPTAKRLSIAVTASADARCLDVEKGDATNDQAAAWVKRQRGRGVRHPVVYTFLANAQPLVDTLARAGLHPDIHYLLWTAHWTKAPHICTAACGNGFRDRAHATQYDDKALGRNLDVSLCAPGFFN